MAYNVFQNLLTKYPGHEIEGYVNFAKARVFFKQKKYKKSRDLLRWIIEKYPNDRNLCASAQLTIASSYDTEGNWERALVEYRWTQEEYPLTFQGFYVPTYIAEYYRRKGKKHLAETAFKEAVEHYSHLIKKYPKTVLAATAQEYIIYCLSVQEKWEEAAKAATSLRRIHPGSRADISSYLFLGQIYEKMNNFHEAIKIYEKFSKEYPDHPIASQVQERLESMRLRI